MEQGQFTDPRVSEYITTVLEERRDAIGQYWFSIMLPLDNFRIEHGSLRYDDLAQQYNVASHARYLRLTWFDWQNEVGKQGAMIQEGSTLEIPSQLRTASEDRYIGCGISDVVSHQRVTVYFHGEKNWNVVGVVRATAGDSGADSSGCDVT